MLCLMSLFRWLGPKRIGTIGWSNRRSHQSGWYAICRWTRSIHAGERRFLGLRRRLLVVCWLVKLKLIIIIFECIVKLEFYVKKGKLLNDDQLVSEVRETILNILAAAALKDDIILVLHQDRREHILMNYANGFDKLPLLEQLALTLFVSTLIILWIHNLWEPS